MSAIGGMAADESGTVPAILHDDCVPLGAWVIAAAYVVLELAVSDRYGFQQDELYFLVASHHLAFGYVDQPPLAVLLARTTDLFGVNPAAIRILPALVGGAIVVLAARLAALFDGGRAARVIAALAVAITPVLLGGMHVGNTTPYDALAWTVVTVCVAMALLRDRPRWWLGAGVAAGLGIEDEYLVLTLLAALVIGILVTPAHRAVMKTRWPWLGGVIALVIWLPNLVWQFASGWPQLTMASALHQHNTSAADYAYGLPAQFVYAGLLGIPLVIAGFITLWRAARLRFLGVAATLILIYVLVWIPGKVYYFDGLITNGKFCCVRRVQLSLTWWRRPLDLRRSALHTDVDLVGEPDDPDLDRVPPVQLAPGRRAPVGSGLSVAGASGSAGRPARPDADR